MQTISQQLAQTIYEQVNAYAEKDQSTRKKYGTMAHKLPILVHTAGLAQALAFVQARGNSAQKALLDHLAHALEYPDGNALANQSRTANLESYTTLTHRVQSALIWYKCFAESILKVKQGDEDPEDSHDS